jgi:Galactose binding lectin domain
VTSAYFCVRFEGLLNAPVDQVNEFCQLETMKGRCRWKSEVIVMTSARWGRMKTGRCLNIHPNFLTMHGQDPLFLGCSEDVLSIVDKKCSGRSECDIRIPDTDLDKVTPCYPDQKSYLEASYACVKGIVTIFYKSTVSLCMISFHFIVSS